MAAVPERLTSAVEDLIDEGSSGFRASAVARRIGAEVGAVAPALMEMVRAGRLGLRFDLVCPDNGRTIQSFTAESELPVGREWASDKCDSPEPFIVDRSHLWVVFVPTEGYRLSIRRRRAASQRDRTSREGTSDPPGLARRKATACAHTYAAATSTSRR